VIFGLLPWLMPQPLAQSLLPQPLLLLPPLVCGRGIGCGCGWQRLLRLRCSL